MSQEMRFNYSEMERVSNQITQDIKQNYINAGNKLISDIETAVQQWEGDSKEKLLTLFKTAVNDYLTKSVPEAIQALGTLLAENAKAMKNADDQIANQIPNSL